MPVNKSLKAYRQLARAARLAFKGDDLASNASRDRIRAEFAKPVVDQPDLLKRLQMARDVAHILRSNVVQGQMNERGNYKLGLHKDTELGDNDSRLESNIMPSGSSQGCCGGSKSTN